ncbi:MAG: hypothetical protein KC635_07495 [Myxococcales bacterium]|nr:hypothetical protein [Myxococcales bacterium]MCB9731222.1 hypothetical protein [Deltaproteobacteria bacterium]
MDDNEAILHPREGHDRRQGLRALWRALEAEPERPVDDDVLAFVAGHESYDIEESAVLGLILAARARGRGEAPGLGVLARMLPMLHGGLDADLRAGARAAFGDRPPVEVFDALYEAAAEDELDPVDEHYALWATRTADRDQLG